MSEKALHAMRETILSHIDEVREAVTLRAPYFGEEKLHVYDLMAPAPVAAKAASTIPYPEGIAIVKKALGTVSPELSGFIDTMLENRWVDAKPSAVPSIRASTNSAFRASSLPTRERSRRFCNRPTNWVTPSTTG